jgi:hypothetical protein
VFETNGERVSRLQDLKPKAPKPAHKPFKAYEPGYLHIDVKDLPHPFGTFSSKTPFRAVDGRRGAAPISLRGDRPCDPLG